MNREPSSGFCAAQEATVRPQLGINISGPFATQKDATKEMCKLFDPDSTDPKKCMAVRPPDACK